MGEVKISNLPERGCAIGERGEECGVKGEGVEMGTVGEGGEGGEGAVSREVEVFQLLQLDKRAVIGHTHTHRQTNRQETDRSKIDHDCFIQANSLTLEEYSPVCYKPNAAPSDSYN